MIEIPPEEFGHGRTRNLALARDERRARGLPDPGRHARARGLAASSTWRASGWPSTWARRSAPTCRAPTRARSSSGCCSTSSTTSRRAASPVVHRRGDTTYLTEQQLLRGARGVGADPVPGDPLRRGPGARRRPAGGRLGQGLQPLGRGGPLARLRDGRGLPALLRRVPRAARQRGPAHAGVARSEWRTCCAARWPPTARTCRETEPSHAEARPLDRPERGAPLGPAPVRRTRRARRPRLGAGARAPVARPARRRGDAPGGAVGALGPRGRAAGVRPRGSCRSRRRRRSTTPASRSSWPGSCRRTGSGAAGRPPIFRIMRELESRGHRCSLWVHDPKGIEPHSSASLRRRMKQHYTAPDSPVSSSASSTGPAATWPSPRAGRPSTPCCGCRAAGRAPTSCRTTSPSSSPPRPSRCSPRTPTARACPASPRAAGWPGLIRERYGAEVTRLPVRDRDGRSTSPCPTCRAAPTRSSSTRATTRPGARWSWACSRSSSCSSSGRTSAWSCTARTGASRRRSPSSSSGWRGPSGCRRLYSEATVGLSLSLTNHSLIAGEMLACGLPVVELAGRACEEFYGADGSVISLAQDDPADIAANLAALLDDPARRELQVPGRTGLRAFSHMGRRRRLRSSRLCDRRSRRGSIPQTRSRAQLPAHCRDNGV